MPNVKEMLKSLKYRPGVDDKPTETLTAMPADAHPSSPQSSSVVYGQYLAEDFVQGGGVAIFHLASKRVVICSADDHRGRTYYFLPKGRRDAGEDAVTGAEREGYEEVCDSLSNILLRVLCLC